VIRHWISDIKFVASIPVRSIIPHRILLRSDENDLSILDIEIPDIDLV
jgi:hypothetical protein